MLYIMCGGVIPHYSISVESRNLHGCCVRRGTPEVSHLFFADDSALFFKAREKEARVFKDVLKVYKNASGQPVNFMMSLICYSPNTPLNIRNAVGGILQVAEHDNLGNYLGLPTAIRHNRKEIFTL